MNYNLKFQLNAEDIAKMQPFVHGRHYRTLAICRPLMLFSAGIMLAASLYDMFQGDLSFPNAFTAIVSTSILIGQWLLQPLSILKYGADVCVSIDRTNLTSSRGSHSYDIPWQYFTKHGLVAETGDLFYLKSRLGSIYIPKRAFINSGSIDRFRYEIETALNDRNSATESCG